MSFHRPFFNRVFSLYILLPCLLALGFLAIVAIVSIVAVIPMGMFTRDVASIAEIHPLFGVVSSITILGWTASATLCLFGWAASRQRQGKRNLSAFLLYAGIFTLLLGLDDLFMLHDYIIPNDLGMSEKPLFIGYGCMLLAGIFIFRKVILKTDYSIAILALAFFGLSLTVDVFQYSIEALIADWRIMFEDGFKLLGVTGFLSYYFKCAILATDLQSDKS